MAGLTPLGAVARGLVAGAAGTAVMTAVQELSMKLQASDEQEGSEQQAEQQQPSDPWEQASAPAKVARKVARGVFDQDISPDKIGPLTHAMHWGYGTSWGAVFGLLEGTSRGRPLRRGVLFGAGVWVMSYVQLVPMGLYEPPWKYSPKDVAMELGYHLAYGAGLGTAWGALDGR